MDKKNNLLDVEYNETNGYSRSLIWVFFIAAIGLRLMLFWVNQLGNAFDDHTALQRLEGLARLIPLLRDENDK